MTYKIRLLPLLFLLLAACNNGDDGPDNTPNPQPNDGDYYLAFTRVDKSTGASCRIVASPETAALGADEQNIPPVYWTQYKLLRESNAATWQFGLKATYGSFVTGCENPRPPFSFELISHTVDPKIGQEYDHDSIRVLVLDRSRLCEEDQDTILVFRIKEKTPDNKVSGVFFMETECDFWEDGEFRNIPCLDC